MVHHGHSLNILCTCVSFWSLTVIVQTSCALVSPSGPSRSSFKHLVYLCLLLVPHGHRSNILCTCVSFWSLTVIVQTSCVLVSPSGPSRPSFKHLVHLCLLLVHLVHLCLLLVPHGHRQSGLVCSVAICFSTTQKNQSKIRYSLHLSWTTNALSACLYALRHRKIIWN